MMKVKIYHNPVCGTSSNVLAKLHERGITPEIIEYLKTPPSREELQDMIKKSGKPVRHFLREKTEPYADLGLADKTISDEVLLDAMMEHPILINRPIVVTDKGVALCRPAEILEQLL